jgi:putative oxidoreductase
LKIVALIARLLLGALFVFSGANHLFNFMKGPLPPGVVGQYMGIMIVSGYMYVIGFMQVAPGLMLLANRYVPLSLIVLAAMIFNIDLVNVLIMGGGPALGISSFITLLWALVFWHERASFRQILTPRPQA